MDYPEPGSFVEDTDEHERVRVTYDSVYSDEPQTMEGNCRETEGNRWVRVVDDSGSVYTVFGYGHLNYTLGDMSKDGRQLGVFLNAVSVNQ